MGNNYKIQMGVWNPLHAELVGTAVDQSFKAWDLRSFKEIYSLHHGSPIRGADFNPNKDYTAVTGGEFGAIKIWDTRKAEKGPLKIFQGAHAHWITTLQYHQHHDTLLLSASDDSSVGLWNFFSQSSAVGQGSADSTLVEDRLLGLFTEHDDSVYQVAWSRGSNPWVFASLSYDGRIVVHKVSKEYSDAILLHSHKDEPN